MDYSDKNFGRMQQEAIERVRQMQKRSRSAVEQAEEKQEKFPAEKEQQPEKTAAENKGIFSISGIKIDEEKALIGMLIYILYKQGADAKLLLALGYLLL